MAEDLSSPPASSLEAPPEPLVFVKVLMIDGFVVSALKPEFVGCSLETLLGLLYTVEGLCTAGPRTTRRIVCLLLRTKRLEEEALLPALQHVH